MKAIKCEEKVFVKLEKGDMIISSIISVCKKMGIETASVSGIGACKCLELGYYDTSSKKYKTMAFSQGYEILSLLGNVTEGEKIHLHITVSDENFNVFGGHLISAEISVTGEIVLDTSLANIKRKPDFDTGLNMWDFQNV